MAPKNQMKTVIQAINSGTKFPAINLVKDNPGLAATVSKLVVSRDNTNQGALKNASETQSARTIFEKRSLDIARKTTDAQSAMQLFPELDLAAQILISSIISPKDMSTGEIIYTAPTGLLTPEINSTLIGRLKDYFHADYKIKPLLPKILREVLFETGSYAIAVLPESSIDDIINGYVNPSMESMSEFVTDKGVPKYVGYLGTPYQDLDDVKSTTTFALEAFKDKPTINNYKSELSILKDKKTEIFSVGLLHITDNANALKIPMAIQAANKKRSKALISTRLTNTVKGLLKDKSNLGIGTEAFSDNTKQLTTSQIKNLVYKNRTRKTISLVRVKTAEQSSRKSIGSPLILRLPSESVIPVHVPGDEEQHVGFFVLLDMEGNPVKHASVATGFDTINGSSSGGELQSVLLERANHSLNGGDKFNNLSFDQGTQIYTDIIETDLKERLVKGIYGKNVSLAKNAEVYRIMLARALSNQYSQLLYIPGELLTYFAYKYDKDGIGKSLLDDMRILNSLRAMTMFARVMASIKNSIGITEVKLKLDPLDPDPTKTIEIAMHEVLKTRQQSFPLGINQAADLADWSQKAGYQFTYEGHPGIPDVGIEFDQKNANYVKPDQDLDDELKKRSIQGFGISPETVDNGFSAEFATTVVSNNLLLSKRVLQIQEVIAPQLTSHARQVATNDATLFDDLKNIIESNFDKLKASLKDNDEFEGMDKSAVIHFLTDWFVNNFELSLPQPDSVTLETQMVAFKIYSEALDETLNSWISTEILSSGMSGEIANQVDNIKAIVKAHYLRKWMAENNVMTELAELTTKDENNKPILDLMEMQANHVNAIALSGTNLFKALITQAKKNDKVINKLTDGDGIEDQNGGGDSSSEGSDDFGGDDFGTDGDDGFGLGDPPTDTDTEEVPVEEEDPPVDDTGEEDPTKGPGKLPDLDKEE